MSDLAILLTRQVVTGYVPAIKIRKVFEVLEGALVACPGGGRHSCGPRVWRKEGAQAGQAC